MYIAGGDVCIRNFKYVIGGFLVLLFIYGNSSRSVTLGKVDNQIIVPIVVGGVDIDAKVVESRKDGANAVVSSSLLTY